MLKTIIMEVDTKDILYEPFKERTPGKIAQMIVDIEKGDVLPLPQIRFQGDCYRVRNGNHRLAAYRKLGRKVKCEVSWFDEWHKEPVIVPPPVKPTKEEILKRMEEGVAKRAAEEKARALERKRLALEKRRLKGGVR